MLFCGLRKKLPKIGHTLYICTLRKIYGLKMTAIILYVGQKPASGTRNEKKTDPTQTRTESGSGLGSIGSGRVRV